MCAVCLWGPRPCSSDTGCYYESAPLHRLCTVMAGITCPVCAPVEPGMDITASALSLASVESFRDVGALKRHLADRHRGLVLCEVCFR